MSHELLVVDDELEICGELSVFFKRRGYQVLATSDSKEAIRLYRSEKPVVVITDYSMPEINGIDLLKQIKAINHTAQVIFVSGKASIQVAVEALKADAFDFLEKPVDLIELECKVKDAFERVRRAGREAKSKSKIIEHETTTGYTKRISVLEFRADLDEFNATRLNEAFKDLLRANAMEQDVALVLKEIQYINNVGLNLLIEMVEKLKERRMNVVLCDLSPQMDHYLRTLGYHNYFKIESGLSRAVQVLDGGD